MYIYKQKKVIAKDAKIIKNIFQQFKGLRFSNQKNLIFEFKDENKISIDMFFVFYPIDLIFLNKDKKIVELKQNLKSFAFYNSKNKAKYVIELRKGSIKGNKLKIGNRLEF